MGNFEYTAKSRSGQSVSGVLTVDNKRDAILELRSRGLQPVILNESDGKKKEKKKAFSGTITGKDIIMFTEELSELLKAGLPLEPSLASMANRDDEGALKTISNELRSHITDGVPLNIALRKVSPKFDSLYCNLVAAGEASGTLESIITHHAKYLKDQAALRAKLIFSMVYPGFITLACIGVLMVFLFYLLPQIAGMMASSNPEDVPLGVRLSISFGDFLKGSWPYILGLIVVLIIGIKFYFDQEKNRASWDATSVKLPFYGKVVQYGFYVRWLQTLSNLLSNGVPLVQSLELTNETVQNRFYKEELRGVTERVKDGLKLTSSMKRAGFFPAGMVDLISVGDETGDMANAVGRAADYYENRLEIVLKSFMGMITPVILLGMALLVGVLCSTMMQAIYGAIENMR